MKASVHAEPCPVCAGILIELGDYNAEDGWNWLQHDDPDEKSVCALARTKLALPWYDLSADVVQWNETALMRRRNIFCAPISEWGTWLRLYWQRSCYNVRHIEETPREFALRKAEEWKDRPRNRWGNWEPTVNASLEWNPKDTKWLGPVLMGIGTGMVVLAARLAS